MNRNKSLIKTKMLMSRKYVVKGMDLVSVPEDTPTQTLSSLHLRICGAEGKESSTQSTTDCDTYNC